MLGRANSGEMPPVIGLSAHGGEKVSSVKRFKLPTESRMSVRISRSSSSHRKIPRSVIGDAR